MCGTEKLTEMQCSNASVKWRMGESLQVLQGSCDLIKELDFGMMTITKMPYNGEHARLSTATAGVRLCDCA